MDSKCPPPGIASAKIREILTYIPAIIEWRGFGVITASELTAEATELEERFDKYCVDVEEKDNGDYSVTEGDLWEILDCARDLFDRVVEIDPVEDDDEEGFEYEPVYRVSDNDATATAADEARSTQREIKALLREP